MNIRTIVATLFFLPSIALACPNLTGSYTCPVPSEHGTMFVNIKIVTEGNKYTITSLDDPSSAAEIWVANEQPVTSTEDAGSEGVILNWQHLTCKDNKLQAAFRTTWYHDGQPYKGETPTVDETLTQTFSLDDQGNLLQTEQRKRLYLEVERQKYPQTSRICTKL